MSRGLPRIAAASLGYAVAGLLTVALVRLSGGTVAVWIANALLIAYAIRRPSASIIGLAAIAFLGTLLMGLIPGVGLRAVLLSAVSNAIEVALIGALLDRLKLRGPGMPDGRRLLTGFGASVAMAPAIAAAFDATLSGVGFQWGEQFARWFVADAFGMFVVLPAAWAYTAAARRDMLHGRRGMEFMACAVAVVAVACVTRAQLHHPYAVLTLPLLVVATQGGVLATATCNALAIASVLVIAILQQRGVLGFPGGSADAPVNHAWFQACLATVGPLLVAVVTGDRDRERAHSLQAGERLQVIADNLPAYVAEFGPDLRYRFANLKYLMWLGKTPDSLIGRTPADALGHEAADRLRPHMERALAGEPQRFEFQLHDQRLDVFYEPMPQSGGFVLMAHDVTWRHDAERRFQHLLESAPDAMLLLDPGTRCILLANRQAERMFDCSRATLIDAPVARFVEGFDRLDADALLVHLAARAVRAHGDVLEFTGVQGSGMRFPVEVVLSELRAGEKVQLVAAIRDVSARRRTERALQEERERAQVTLDSIGDAVVTCDTAQRVTSVNPIAEAMTGLARADALGQPLSRVVRLRQADGLAANNLPRSGAALLQGHEGQDLHVEYAHSPITDGEGRIVGGVTVLRDVSEMRAMAERMSHLAQHDYLTGLPNRVLLQDRLSQAIHQVEHGAHGAVMFLDLDFFKTINDSLGHPVGDRVLQEISRRLVEGVRPDDTVSRQGGDEFVLLLTRLTDPSDAARIAEKLIAAIEAPIELEGRTLHVSATIGIALFPEDGQDMRMLTKQADTALYHAKQSGRGRYSYFTAVMSERADQRLRLESELRTAIAEGQLFLVYQPKMLLPERQLSGMEALVRWRHPDGHVVTPLDFIPVAEETGLVVAIDDWVLREACRQNRAWIDAGLPALPVAVNLSLARFDPARIVSGLAQALGSSGMPAELLEVELTESQMLTQGDRADQLIRGIRALGVRVSVDDFGTGYSSLGYLTRHRFDAIKIDRSFVHGLPGDAGQKAVVEAIVAMGRALEYRVIGEGVETEAQAQALLMLGCNEMQGYLLGRPLPASAMEQLLRDAVA
ncbi:EAL domain-containing protein [Cognatilysobacter lacus]|nr:EAL domain-containing protein [Lysobacter lacus]